MEGTVVMGDQIVRGGKTVSTGETVNTGSERVNVDVFNIPEGDDAWGNCPGEFKGYTEGKKHVI